MHIHELIAMIEAEAPPECAASWDRGGVQVAGGRQQVRKLALGLDPTPELVERALEWGADFILVHHPLALKPDLPSRPGSHYHQVLGAVFRRDAWLYAAHTSLDTQPHGPARWLAQALELRQVGILEKTGQQTGRWFRILGNEDAVSRLRQELEAQPGLEVFAVSAQALEVVSPPALCARVRRAVTNEPGDALRMISQELDLPTQSVGFGFVGDLPEPLSWTAFLATLERVLARSVFTIAGIVPDQVRRVACCPGSGASLLARAGMAGADVYITGDFKYHDAQAVHELGFLVADVGHFILEERMMRELAEIMRRKLMDFSVEVAFFPGSDAFVHLASGQEGASALPR